MGGLFHKAIGELLRVNAAVFAIFLFGPGLTPPPQTSVRAPSGGGSCDAPEAYYERVGLLHPLMVLAISASCCLAGFAGFHVAAEEGETLAAMDARTKLKMRAAMLLAIAFSLAAFGLAFGVYGYILQIKYTTFACMPGGVFFLVIALGLAAVAAILCIYTAFVRTALRAD